MASGIVAAAAAVLLLLLACGAASAQQASANAVVQPSARKSPPARIRGCTHAQKMNILRACWRWVKLVHGHHVVPPNNGVFDPCCNAVRDVRALDMNCIVDLLTGEGRRRYDASRIRSLKRMCSSSISPASLLRLIKHGGRCLSNNCCMTFTRD